VSKVIHSYNVHENYLTLNSGELEGIKPDMGVINSLGIVGIENTSPNYATVISILNKKSQINAKIKKSNHFGSLIWNGKSTGFVQLVDVPRLAAIYERRHHCYRWTICNFSRKYNIGTIDKIEIDNQTNYYTITVRLFNDMTNLGHVYIIKNKDREEITNLEKRVKMNSALLVNIFRFILLLAFQIIIFNNMNFWATSVLSIYYSSYCIL
jgi:rod shape-determining protein MreC